MRNLPGLLVLKPEDGRSLHYFQLSTAPELAGGFADDFWTRLVIQVGHREDCVRYMVLALASLHESICISSSTPLALQGRAASYYTRALRALNHHIASHQSAALDITLLCSILCVTFEWLRADNSAALVHLRAGLLLLLQWHEATLSGVSPSYPSHWSPSGHFIRSTLLPFYTRLFVQVQTVCDHGLSPPPVESPTDGAGRPFANLKDARDDLYKVLGEAYHPKAVDLALRQGRKAGPRISHSLSTHIAHTLWCRRLDEFHARFPEARNTLAAHNLRILREATTIMVSVEGTDYEADFDCFTTRFGGIVELVEQLYSVKATTFSPDMSVIAVLYYVGVKCTHPAIGRKAIGLLERALRREGIWHSVDAVRVAQQLDKLEKDRASTSRCSK